MVGFNAGRFEHKYLVDEATAQTMRGFVQAYLDPDGFMPQSDLNGYQVHSLYLDTPWLNLYQESTDGIKNRYKLRIRFYDDDRQAPAFLEIKTRITQTIQKMRAAVSKEAAEKLLCGLRLTPLDLLVRGNKSARAINEFCDRYSGINASGAAFVSYQREAYESRQAEAVRVTFDRNIRGSAFDVTRGLRVPTDCAGVTPGQVVFEMKYVGHSPEWVREMVRAFRLNRVSYPKYVHCVDALRPHQARTPGAKRLLQC